MELRLHQPQQRRQHRRALCNAQATQKVTLSNRAANRSAGKRCNCPERREIDMGCQVVFAGRFKGIGKGMALHGLKRFTNGRSIIAIVDNQRSAPLLHKARRHRARHRGPAAAHSR